MGYSKDDILKVIENREEYLYKKKAVNYHGHFDDETLRYTEYIAQYILQHEDFFDEVKARNDIRQGNFKMDTHKVFAEDEPCVLDRREEEWIAKEIYNKKDIENLGKVLDYQVPLKNPGAGESNAGLGKIDLLSFNKEKEELTILELKRPNTYETLLKCILEIYTYYCMVEKRVPVLVNEFDVQRVRKFNKAVLIFDGEVSQPYKDLMNKEDNKYALQLMKKLGVGCYVLDSEAYLKAKEFKVREVLI